MQKVFETLRPDAFTECCCVLGFNSNETENVGKICDEIIRVLKENRLSYKQAEQVLECTKARLSDIRI